MPYKVFFNKEEKSLTLKKIEDDLLVEEQVLCFQPVQEEELFELRMSHKPGAVYKKEDELYYVELPINNVSFLSKEAGFGDHFCSKNCNKVCNGCQRTFDLTAAYHVRNNKPFDIAVEDSWRIEKYDFILEGVEVFNMSHEYDAFIVMECANYEKTLAKSDATQKPTTDQKVALFHFFAEDFDGDRTEMLKRLKEIADKNRIREIK